MRKLGLLMILLSLIASVGCGNPQGLDTRLRQSLSSIREDAIRSHLEFLADDALEGRHTGSRGFDLAARYVRAQFTGLGLKSGTKDNSYFQPVHLRQTEVDGNRTSLVIESGGHTKALAYNKDFILLDTHARASDSVSAPVVFAGYGVAAPEFQYDDYAGLDVKGKVVAVLDFEAPPSFPATERAYYMDYQVKCEIARDHGAIGLIGIPTPNIQEKFPWESVLRDAKIGFNSLRWLDRPDHVFGTLDEIRMYAYMNQSGAEALFEGAPESLDAVFAAAKTGKSRSFPVKKTVRVQYQARHTPVSSVNVVGFLAGSDTERSKEYVVVTAHLDHLGIGPAVNGDAIYNGALDNASGSSVMIEVARFFATLPKAPARSVVFVALTGEEEGMLGSHAFANNPPLPGRIVANINLDEAAFPVPIHDVSPLGAEHSSLGLIAQRAAGQLELTLSPDPFPDEGVFVRSDQYAFVRTGVPALFLTPGMKLSDPGIDAEAAVKKWLVTNYHSPKDDASQPIPYGDAVRLARFAALVTYYAANDASRPAWNPNDFFGKRFARQ